MIPRAICVTLFICLTMHMGSSHATTSHKVKGYTKKNGRYVKAYRATNSNRTQRDNWSSKPNTNPYTGKEGAREPKK